LRNPVIISGISCLTPFGRGLGQAWSKIVRGERSFGVMPQFSAGPVKPHLCGLVSDEDIDTCLPSRKFVRLPRYSKLVLSSAAECLRDAGLERLGKAMDPERIGVFLGTARGPQEAVESISLKLVEGAPHQINPLHFQETVYNAPLGHLSIHYGITGMCVAFSSGQASGLQALDAAVSFLDTRKIDLALVGGVDTVTEIYMRGMADVRVLSPQGGGREETAPFAAARNGTIVGEGGAFLALERNDSNRARGGARYAEIVSTAIASDGFSHYRNDPSGKGFEYAIRKCLQGANLTAKDIHLIIACASGQPELDRSEWSGIASACGDDAARIPVTSIKGVSGDLGAASQILAVALCSEIFKNGLIPGTFHDHPLDPDCPLQIIRKSIEAPVETALLNEASWGGVNATVFLKKV